MNSFLTFVSHTRDLFIHNSLFCIGLLLLGGFFFGQLAKRLKLPSITGFIIAGLLMGKSVLGLVPESLSDSLSCVTRIALAIIALTIGAEFEIKKLLDSGPKILFITCAEAICASIAVFTAFVLLGLEIKYALILGAIAAATAPAATVVIIRQLKARGKFVEYLYGVVAFDDAICIILFSMVFAMVVPLMTGTGAVTGALIASGFFHAVAEIWFSVILGVIAGFALHLVTIRERNRNKTYIVTIAFIFTATSAASMLHLSLLITNMTIGAVLINLSKSRTNVFKSIMPVSQPIFALFFVLAGAELDIALFSKKIIILYAAIYLLSRFIGKYSGVFFSTRICNAPSNIKKYLGFCLFPQAGVAIGLILFVQTSPLLAEIDPKVKASILLIVNVVLLSIFISELIGPSISKYGILKGVENSK